MGKRIVTLFNTYFLLLVTLFKKNLIHSQQIFTIVNVWSYKVRACVCAFSFGDINILGYAEKRQSRLDIINNEIHNISWISETIKQAIVQAELQAWCVSTKIIVNPFFTDIYFYPKKVHYKHTDNTRGLTKKDISSIIHSIEYTSVHSIENDVINNLGMAEYDLQLILGNISKIHIDWELTTRLLGEKGEDIIIEILHSFIPKINFQIIQDVSHYIEKEIAHIIPEEYSILKVLDSNKRLISLDIGNTSTSISLVEEDNTLGNALKLSIWIDDLIKIIRKNENKSRSEIIKKLNRTDLFKNEKEEFLWFFSEILITGLKEILHGTVCPHYFTIIWWGWNNDFFKEHLSKINFAVFGIKITKKQTFIEPSIEEIKKIRWVENILNSSNITLISQILATHSLLYSQKSVIKDSFENSVNTLLH